MEKIQYSLITIAGQTTALVEVNDAPTPILSRSAQAKLIMAKNPIIEQVGFVNPIARPNPKSMMMGNELSVIGSLAAGVWLINKGLAQLTTKPEQPFEIISESFSVIKSPFRF